MKHFGGTKSSYTLYCVCVLLCFISYPKLVLAQDFSELETSYNTYRKGVQSPSVEAFNKVGEVPVNLYTGQPNISVPIYTINTSGKPISMSLSYDASGIKVGQQASEVGLGWSFIVGGVITRIMQSHPDDGYNSDSGVSSHFSPDRVYPALIDRAWDSVDELSSGNWDHKLDYMCTPTGWTCQDLDDLAIAPDYWAADFYDTSPDVFSFNVNGLSGKFMLDEVFASSAISGTIELLEKNNVRVKWYKKGGPQSDRFNIIKFEIIDADGTKYTFDKIETVRIVNSSLDGLVTNYNTSAWYSDFLDYSKYNNSWHLTKIEFANTTEIITFDYSPHLKEVKTPSDLSRTTDWRNPAASFQFLKSQSLFEGHILTGISTDNEDIEVFYNDEDFLGLDFELSNKTIDEVRVKNKSGIVLSRFKFSYSYFSSENDNLGSYYIDGYGTQRYPEYYVPREAKLNSIYQVDPNDVQFINKHDFEYFFGDLPLNYDIYRMDPSKFDMYGISSANWYGYFQNNAIDYWGYYNGAVTTGISGNVFNERRFRIPISSMGNVTNGFHSSHPFLFTDRSPNIQFAKIGSLKKITYPTGGYVEFDYELHDYSWKSKLINYDEVISFGPSFYQVIANKVSNNSNSFTIDEYSNGYLWLKLEITTPQNVPRNATATATISRISPNPASSILTINNPLTTSCNNGCTVVTSYSETEIGEILEKLEPGNYTIDVSISGGNIGTSNLKATARLYRHTTLKGYDISKLYTVLNTTDSREIADLQSGQFENNLGSGLRIKKMQLFAEPNDPRPITKEYFYTETDEATGLLSNRSSGVLNIENDSFHFIDYVISSSNMLSIEKGNYWEHCATAGYSSCDYNVDSKYLNYSYSPRSSNDPLIGYREVTVKTTGSQVLGKTRNIYYSAREVPDFYFEVPQIVLPENSTSIRIVLHHFYLNRSWARGKELKSEVYNSNNALLQSVENEYSLNAITSESQLIPSLTQKKLYPRLICGSESYFFQFPCNGIGREYTFFLDFQTMGSIDLVKQTSKVYEGQTTPLITTREFDYVDVNDQVRLLRKITETNTDGVVKQSIATYAHEIYDSSNGMLEYNQLAQPYSIELQDSEGNTITKSWTLWKDWNLGGETKWLPCGQWIWDGALQSGIPVAPTNCSQN